MGEVGLPCRVTGLAAISISEEITFMPAFHASSNSSQWGLAWGVACRLILKRTLFLLSAMGFFIQYEICRDSVLPRTWRDQRNIHRLEFKTRFIRIRGEVCLGCLQPVFVVAVRKIRLVMRPSRFITKRRALGDHAGQLQHVVKLTRKHDGCVRPL